MRYVQDIETINDGTLEVLGERGFVCVDNGKLARTLTPHEARKLGVALLEAAHSQDMRFIVS